MSALKRQVGGDHYKGFEIQPAEFIYHNDIGFLPGCVIKRMCRFDRPGGKGVEDLEKAKHEIDIILSLMAERPGFVEAMTATDNNFAETMGGDDGGMGEK